MEGKTKLMNHAMHVYLGNRISRGLKISRKTQLLLGFTLLGAAAGALLVAGRAQADTLGFSLAATPAAGAGPGDVAVLVLDDETGLPLADAELTAQATLGADTASTATTGPDGSLLIKGALSAPVTWTVTRAGYASVALVGAQSPQVTFHLKALPKAEPVIASGIMPTWAGGGGGENVTAGLVFKSMSAFDLLQFNADSFVSPLKDSIDILGRREIPSNLVLPEQDVFFLFASFTLNKPTYRLPLPRGKESRIAGVQGSIATRDIVSLAQSGGKLSLELLNKLKFSRAGVTGPLRPEANFNANVNASYALRAAHRVSVSPPPFKSDVIVVAATDLNGDRNVLLPTDIKLALAAGASGAAKPLSVNAPDNVAGAPVGKSKNVLAVALGEKGRRLSGIVADNAGQTVQTGEFLRIDELSDAPALPEKIALRPTANGVSALVFDSAGVAFRTVYLLPAAGQATLPVSSLPGAERGRATAYSTLSLEFGAGFDGRSVDGKSVMMGLKRFGRAMAKIGAQPKP